MALAAAGTDPIQARKVERAASVVLSVDAAMAHYFKTHRDEWRSPKTVMSFENLTRVHIAPTIGKLAVASITYGDVLRVLAPHWASKTTSMVRLRGWLFLALESTRGKPGGLSEDQRNPADWQRLRHDLASPRKISKLEHHPAMEWTLVPDFMARLRDIDGLIARTLEFTVLTAVRLYPVRAMQWREVDLEAAIWTIPRAEGKIPVLNTVCPSLLSRDANPAGGPPRRRAARGLRVPRYQGSPAYAVRPEWRGANEAHGHPWPDHSRV